MAPSRKPPRPNPASSLFSSTTYDSDAPTYTSVPTADSFRSSSSHLSHPSSVSDSDEDLGTTPKDLDVLQEEEEREKLLSKGGLFGSLGRREGVVIGKRTRRNATRRPGIVLFGRDSEERIGGGAGEYDSAEEEQEEDKSEIDEIKEIRKGWVYDKRSLGGEPRPSAPSLQRMFWIAVGLLAFLLLLIYTSFRLSLSTPPHKSKEKAPFHKIPLSNGTHTYHPTTLLISLDGFRASYLSLNITPTLQSFLNSGLSTPYLTPSFPSVTFPNHWTLITGLHPESHGIVGNSFFDPASGKEYTNTNRSSSTFPFWYGGDPIWSIAEENGIKSAIHMWPGSETYIYHPEAYVSSLDEFKNQPPGEAKKRMKPSIVDPYNGQEALSSKVSRLLSWLDLPLPSRPQFILGYVPNIDTVGHIFGPNTPEEKAELKKVDDMFRLLLSGIEERNLTEIVNIVVVSDHGMAKTSTEKLIYLEDILGADNLHAQVGQIEGWPLSGLRPRPGVSDIDVWEEIKSRHRTWPPKTPTGQKATLDGEGGEKAPWKVFHKNHDMPSRWHFAQNDRIAPVWIVPDVGWVCVTEEEYPHENMPKGGYHPRGVHGYDNSAVEMRAVFLGWGPGLRAARMHGEGREWRGLRGELGEKGLEPRVDAEGKRVQGVRVAPFGNWEVYGIIGELVFGAQLAPEVLASHNGTFLDKAGGKGKSVFEGMEVLKDGEWKDESSPPKAVLSLKSGSLTTIPTRPVIAKLKSTLGAASAFASASASTTARGVDVAPTTVFATATVVSTSLSLSPSPSATGKGDESKQDESKQDEKEDLDHKPSTMTWWEWAKWRAERLKEKLEAWWGEVWDGYEDAESGEERGGKHEGKGA